MRLTTNQRHALLGGTLLVGVLVTVVLLVRAYGPFVRVQVLAPGPVTVVVGGNLRTDPLSVGAHTIRFQARTQSGQMLSDQVVFDVDERPGGGGGGGGGGGEGGGGDPTEERSEKKGEKKRLPEIRATVVIAGPSRHVEGERTAVSAPALVGDQSFSSDRQRHGSRTGVLLAHEKVRAEYRVVVPRRKYLLEITAQHDRPAPVRIAVSVNGRSWKVVEFKRGNGRFATLPVGILRNFSGGTVAFRLLNDFFDRTAFLASDDERHDRNAFIDKFTLTPVE